MRDASEMSVAPLKWRRHLDQDWKGTSMHLFREKQHSLHQGLKLPPPPPTTPISIACTTTTRITDRYALRWVHPPILDRILDVCCIILCLGFNQKWFAADNCKNNRIILEPVSCRVMIIILKLGSLQQNVSDWENMHREENIIFIVK